MDNIKNSDSVNLIIHGSNGQQQTIKIMRNPNGMPLTQEGVKAIVKEFMNSSSNSSESFQQRYNSSLASGSGNSNSSSSVHSSDAGVSTGAAAAVTLTAASVSHSAAIAHQSTTTSTAFTGNRPTSTASAASVASAASAPGSISSSSNSSGASSTFKTVAVPPPQATKHATKQIKMQQAQAAAGSSSYSTGTPTTAQKKTRRRKTDRVGKGLRHFSMKVCEKVREKGTTTYNEVADELVEEFCSMEAGSRQPVDPASYDQKNIRRRVYDALNVLMAMNIISKDKKEIRWIGLPTNSAQQCTTLELENRTRKERIEVKQQELRNLILQQVSFKSLVTRNKESEERGIVPSPSSAIQMPFIIVNTHKKTHVNCSISNDKSEYQFKFDDEFSIHDDIEVLKRMGLLLGLDTGDCTYDDIERAKTMVPKAFEKFIECYGRGKEECLSFDDADEALFNEESIIMKTEQMSDEEELLDDDHYSDMSDME